MATKDTIQAMSAGNEMFTAGTWNAICPIRCSPSLTRIRRCRQRPAATAAVSEHRLSPYSAYRFNHLNCTTSDAIQLAYLFLKVLSVLQFVRRAGF